MILEGLVIPISFNTGLLMEGIKAITGLVTGAVERTQEWTNGLDQLGDVTGMSTDKLAAWSFVAKKAGVEIDTLSNATVIMSKGLLDSSGELSTTGKALEDFGVSVLDAGGKVRDQSDLMNDIAKKYAEFGSQTERVDFLTNVFGKSGAGLIDVFDTLAKEGGIDNVITKVDALGLTLNADPYEDFQRNLSEIDLTFTGLANSFTGPLLPGASELLQTFTRWLQAPWVADAITGISEKIGTLASDISAGIETGDWDAFFADFKEFTGFDLAAIQANFNEFEASSQTETAAIKQHWNDLVASMSESLNLFLGTEGINLFIDWKQVGITALQAVDIALYGLTKTVEFFRNLMLGIIDTWNSFKSTVSNTSVYVPAGGASYSPPKPAKGVQGRAAGGMAGGLTWVGERGPELVNLPNGSNVNNAQTSANMGIDYYKLASILAVEFAKARD